MTTTSIFSAQEPTLGYLYQVKYSLLQLIRSSHTPNAKVAIEKLDDIELIGHDYTNLYQTKYHLNSVANLTDRSEDLWKTIRVWSTGIDDNTIDIKSTFFHLITTATVSDGTIAKELTKPSQDRDLDVLVGKLEAIAAETTNRANQAGYEAFNNLSAVNKRLLVGSILICESSIGIEEVDDQVRLELRKVILDEKVPILYEGLTGWYLGQSILILLNQSSFVTFNEYQKKCFDIIETLKRDNLPIDFLHPVQMNPNELETYKDRTFVKQLKIIGVDGKMLGSAISDYYRAYQQRSNWVRSGLIGLQEEIDYEARLFDEWDRRFTGLIDVDDQTSADAKQRIGKDFYRTQYIVSPPRIFIREKFDHTFMVTGSCQILSDAKKIGWHPDFKDLIE